MSYRMKWLEIQLPTGTLIFAHEKYNRIFCKKSDIEIFGLLYIDDIDWRKCIFKYKITNKHLLPAKAQKQYWPISKEYAANNLYIYI